MENIIWLDKLTRKDIDVAGGKGANLAEMFNLKLPVPQAFVISAKTFEKFLIDTKIKARIEKVLNSFEIENTAELEKKAKEIRDMILEEDVPKDLQAEIIEAYDSLSINDEIIKEVKEDILKILKASKEPVFVAVRSSATTEDLATASFAGQQETFVNIQGNENLIDAVKKCWASLFTARAVYYRERKGFRHANANLAVVVQKMVNSDKSGVMFTIDPLTNKSEIIIEGVYGLGEGIVSGAIAPNHYVINKDTFEIMQRKIVKQDWCLTRNSRGETVRMDIPLNKRNEQVLNDSELKKLAVYGKQLEQHYQKPQDIEFAIENDKIYIVQTRPVTTSHMELKKGIITKATPLIEGLPASPGIGSGPVKIINAIDDLSKIKKGDILVTKMTNPDMVVTMQKCAAIITDEGGATAHAAIVSREMGLPCVVGTMKATSVLEENQIVTVDGTNGKVYAGKAEIPDKNIFGEPQTKQQFIELKEKIATKTRIYMNLGEPQKIQQYKNLQFDGIGLMRIEFIIAGEIGKHPLAMIVKGEQQKYIDKLAQGIEMVAKTISPKPVVVRFSDFKTNEYRGLEGGDKYEMQEDNPMIGFRGVSRYISEEFQAAFRLECKAIKKVVQQCKNVWVMLPFVRTINEVEKCIEIMNEEDLIRSDIFKIWLMAEVPSMAILADEFAKLDIDGVSIGSNDLTQLILGVDRDSALLGKLGYFDERNPAVLRAIKRIIREFTAKGKTVSICGQAPSVYPEIVDFLIENGATSISVNPDAVNSVRLAVAKKERMISEGKSGNSNADSIEPLKEEEIDNLLEKKKRIGYSY